MVLTTQASEEILDLEYVDMAELLPDGWLTREEDQRCCHSLRRPQRRGPVTDILLWVECYSTMVAILASKFPDKMPELMAYQKTIVRAHRSFIGNV